MKGLYIALDGDKAGREKALEFAQLFPDRAGIVSLPDGLDVCDYMREHPKEDFQQLLNEATPSINLIAAEVRNAQGIHAKAKALQAAVQVIATVDDDFVSGELLKELYKRCPDLPKKLVSKRFKELREKSSSDLPTGSNFKPDRFADALLEGCPTINYREVFWRWDNGRYIECPEWLLKRELQELGQGNLRKGHYEDALHSLRIKTYVRPQEVNKPGIINLRNGYIDLTDEDMELKAHHPELLTTLQLPIEVNGHADCPLFTKFLADKVPSPQLQSVLQEMTGYLLTPSTAHQKGFILNGPAASGKSTFLHIIGELLGKENRSALPLDQLGGRFQTAAIDGKLANLTSEVGAKTFVADGIVKAIIAGDELTVERKYENPYEFKPYCRLVVGCNDLPLTHDVSHAFWRRWIMVPFDVPTLPSDYILDLPDRICAEELPGVLLWALAGLSRLREQGRFTEPVESREALEGWQRSVDPVREFAHRYLVHRPGQKERLRKVFDAFSQWVKESGRKAQFTDSNFKARLEGAGYDFKRTKVGQVLADHLLTYSPGDGDSWEG